MTSYAVSHDVSFTARRAKPRHRAKYRAAVQWNLAVPSQVQALRPTAPESKRAGLALLVAAAIALHAGAVWYSNHAQPEARAPKVRNEVAVELVRPPPPPPKIEEPKPQPPPKKVPVRVLPQIQAPTPEPPTLADAVSTEPPVAVAPIVSEPPAPAPELPVTPPIGRAGYLNNPPPEYPVVAVRQQWEGTVLLRVRVLSDGRADSIEVKQSSGRRILDEEAIKTVKSWRFTPSKRGDTPIEGWATVPIEFKLDS